MLIVDDGINIGDTYTYYALEPYKSTWLMFINKSYHRALMASKWSIYI